jgi:hypothetical protein
MEARKSRKVQKRRKPVKAGRYVFLAVLGTVLLMSSVFLIIAEG